jgi:tRNA G18 (ribose-2'-O)-methylase SpoU
MGTCTSGTCPLYNRAAMDRIIRINPLLEALRSAPERVNKIFVQEERGHARIGEVIREAKAHHVPVVFVPVRRLDQVAPGHQGVNLVRAMEELKDKGLWLVGAEGSGDEPWYAFDYTGPVGIVLGSEGKGLRPLVRKTCDKVLAIPLSGKVGSLNVAAAAAVFLFEVVRQRRKP